MEWTWGDAAGIGSMQPEAPKAGLGSMLDRWDSWMQAVFGDTIVERQRQAIEAMKRGDRETAERLTTGLATDFGGFLGSIKPIRAFHGSPHDFDRFSLEHIGKGEGAQAYGHGLYFAENEGVARSYRDALANGVKIDGVPYDGSTTRIANMTPGNHAADALRRFNLDKKQAIAWLRESGGPTDAEAAKLIARAKNIEPWNGNMYEVAIHADPERFLDWDKPLSGGNPIAKLVDESAGRLLEGAGYGGLRNEAKDAILALRSGNMTGEGAYDRLALLNSTVRPAPGGRFIEPNKRAATESLRDAGIPGIKYLDAGSRAAGDGSRNYVVFDDSIIEILRKYGLAGLTAGGGAAGLGALAYPEDEGL